MKLFNPTDFLYSVEQTHPKLLAKIVCGRLKAVTSWLLHSRSQLTTNITNTDLFPSSSEKTIHNVGKWKVITAVLTNAQNHPLLLFWIISSVPVWNKALYCGWDSFLRSTTCKNTGYIYIYQTKTNLQLIISISKYCVCINSARLLKLSHDYQVYNDLYNWSKLWVNLKEM